MLQPTITQAKATAFGDASSAHPKDVKLDENQQLVSADTSLIYTLGGAAGGKRAPVGAIVKVAAMTSLTLRGLARQAIACGRRPDDCAQKAARTPITRFFPSQATDDGLWDAPNLELMRCRKAAGALLTVYTTGALREYADQLGPAAIGADCFAGGKVDRVCDANI